MRCAVDEVCPGNDGGRETYCGPVKGGDENLGVGIESVSHFEVVRHKGGEPLPANINAFRAATGDGDVCTAVGLLSARLFYAPTQTPANHDALTQRRNALFP